jgi:uncharacterized SAM-binding protein YcdF (DUF218 family)/glycosyltransferase involved in cell wall biosynthesis
MLHNKNIICISSIDWDFVWQGHQEIMDTFAREGNKVLFVENTGIRTPKLRDLGRLKHRIVNWRKGLRGIRQEGRNLFICSPLILPFPYSRIAKIINRFLLVNSIKEWMKAIDFKNPVIWTFLPTATSINIIDNIDHSLVVYYCIAEFRELADSSKKVERTEIELLRRSDVVFAQGEKIKARCLKYNKNVHIFPFGVNEKTFNIPIKTPGPGVQSIGTSDIDSIPGKRIGYIGGIHKHLDVGLLKGIARKRPDWSIVLVGPMQIEKNAFAGHENIHCLGKREFNQLPFYILHFDTCLIPYLLTEYTKTVYPTKLNEYLAMKKPVISTPIPEVEEFARQNEGIIEIADSVDSFCKKIDNALKEGSNPGIEEIREKRRNAATKSSWTNRINEMSAVMEETLDAKSEETANTWRDSFVRIARTARRKFIVSLSILTLSYIALFYTPVLWWAASPLKISQAPERADAIVVFGGGVGETGSPGKSTIERAIYSAELYNDGYANRIIYSSGYTWKYNDAENMKLIAVSKGVSEQDIILDKKGDFTYTNVKFAAEILRKNNFNKIILVSSPYNMRRASLVFNHIAKDIDVIYVPVKFPQFYSPHDQYPIRLEQIKAIVHEYLGIVYYIFKGYI